MSARIRDARPEDAAAIAQVHGRSRLAAYRGRVDDALLEDMSPEERRRRWGAWLAEPAITTLVLEAGTRLVAFATLRPSRDGDVDSRVVGEIPTLYVDPDWWRKGLGSRLCGALCRRAASLGFAVVTLWVLELNLEARRFYEAYGFREDGATKLDDGPTPAPFLALRYRLRLSGSAVGVKGLPAS